MIKVSIIIPVYNAEKYLNECLNSVINQTLKDIEIICVNDGSTDKSLIILEEYAKKDDRIKVITQKNSGMGRAYNTGLKIAQGEYIGFVEADDFVDLNMFETLYNYAIQNNSDIVKSCYFDNFNFDEYKSIKKINWFDAEYINDKGFSKEEAKLFLSFHPSIWSCLYKTDFLNKHNIHFSESKPTAWADNLFQVQTFCMAERFFYTNKAFYYWRRKNTDDSKDLKDYKIPIRKIIEIHKWLKDNNIEDETTLSYLCRRELKYLDIVIKKLNVTNFLSGIIEIKKVVKVLDKKLVNNKILDTAEKNELKNLLNNTINFVIKNKIKLASKPLTDSITDIIILLLIKTDKKIVFWGESIFLEEFLKKYNVEDKNILGIIDKDKTKENLKIGEYIVYQPEKLIDLKPDLIIFTIKNRHEIIYPKVKEYIEETCPQIKFVPDIFVK